MKEYQELENRESDWLSKQKRLEKETLDLDEAKEIKQNHEQIHKKEAHAQPINKTSQDQARSLISLFVKIGLLFILVQFIATLITLAIYFYKNIYIYL